ncbi:PREDICTED: dnaJ homolog subfamily C member 30-like [Cyprinodon variegatus]|uniref:dnaJ homolog subfamily C member 30-like n=1 Tax=Cyprinodon variegatus TaxID=28743 RepID=UPI0007427736|nr:PREDICTED: dnaJ homolog subfamily C member 30-like [Cyprinodon variegatus]
MAEVRHCAGRGACETGLKMFKSYLLGNRIPNRTRAVPPGSLSAGFLFDDIKNRRRKAERSASPAAGGHRDGYAKGPSSLHLDPGSPHFITVRNYSGNGSRSEPLYRTKTGYYDILEVSPTATQAQIKTAYYKQSFTYHPDRNSGSEEATVRFSEISEAYMVLGNKGLRKKYDRGLLSLSDLTTRARPSTGGSVEQQAGGRRAVMGADLRERIFDFDKFYKAHYEGQLQRQRDIRVRKEEMLKRTQENVGDKQLGRMTEIGVGMLLVFAVGILLSLKT